MSLVYINRIKVFIKELYMAIKEEEVMVYLKEVKVLAKHKQEADANVVEKKKIARGREKLVFMESQALADAVRIPLSRLQTIIRKMPMSFIKSKTGLGGGYLLNGAPAELSKTAKRYRQMQDTVTDVRKWKRKVALTAADVLFQYVTGLEKEDGLFTENMVNAMLAELSSQVIYEYDLHVFGVN
jgi:hypothetical protein